ncbi:MAG: T9SS type A sorting domain-containing protein [Bacteroidetes bacterium]|nr:T9SS type A sorting domain-containing protein [Bacteroidota bacterium]
MKFKVVIATLLVTFALKGQINYSFSALTSAYTANSAPTVLHASLVDDGISVSTAIGFNFCFGGSNYSTFQVSTNGVMFLGTTGAGSNLSNNLNTNFDRPIIAPLWDDLKTSSTGNVNYKLTGVAPNRILTVEWKDMLWNYTAAGAVISFQVKLYETSNVITFGYFQNGTAVNVGSASIGLGGQTSGDYYSLNGTGASPAASKLSETSTLNTKPATNQVYSWSPTACSGAPTGGTASASPSYSCIAYSTTLSLSGATSACGITYQWQSSASSTGPWSNITGATSASTVVTVSSTTYYKCVLACGGSTAASSVAGATLIASGSCGICGITSITIPYTTTGQTTCGQGNDVTSTNVTNVCGSTSYYGGEDVVYSFTPSATGQVGINVTSTGSWMGAMLYQGCPASGGTCVGNSQSSAGNQSLCATVTAGQAYYLVLDSWPSPTCNPYDLSITGCSGTPVAGTAVATPTLRCSNYTTTLSLSGAVASCGVSYQWQSSSAATGPWANIAGATAPTATAAISSNTYFQCILSCNGFSSTSGVATASITVLAGCGICNVQSITLPYNVTGQTTCGQGDDVTAINASTVCGLASYYGGEDVTYSFTASVTGTINITVNSSGSSVGVTLYKGCPVSGGTCVANAQGASGYEAICNASVVAGQVYYLNIDSWPSPTCNPYNLSISAPTGTTAVCNMNYSPSTTTYSFEVFTGNLCPSTDDVLYNNAISFGFPMCFDGSQYYGGYIASNCAFVFDAVPCFPNIQTSTYAAGGVGTGYSISGPAPAAATSIPRNAILAPWHDSNPSLGGIIQYTTTGVAPNRKFICSYENVPMFSCGTSSPAIYFSGQIKLFETSYDIEIHIKKKGVCPGWNNGQAILGLHNYNGTTYIPPVNATIHNATAATPYNQWTMTNTAYKFTNNCGSICAAVLPVNFTKFYGERVDQVNYLYWETAEEENLLTYKVERSTDALNFTEIGQVAPQNKPSKYQFADAGSVPGMINYYRITSVELNGKHKSTFIYPLGAKDGELAVTTVYPNPTKNSFKIGFDSKMSAMVTINIYNSLGVFVKKVNKQISTGLSEVEISGNELSPGVYIIEILTDKQVLTKQKLIKVD